MKQISWYKNALDNVGTGEELLEALATIRSPRYKDTVSELRKMSPEEYKEAKKSLPAVTFSGLFSERKASALVRYSGLITIDIDNLDGEAFVAASNAVVQDDHSFAVFISPSGKGLKILFKLGSKPEHHGQAFKAIEKYFKDNYAISIDKSGKDICRLCFLSHDPQLFYNKDAKLFLFEVVEEKKRVTKKVSEPSSDSSHIFNVCVKWVERKFSYNDGEKNVFIHNLACTLNRCGVSQSEALGLIDKNYLTPDDKWHQSVDSAYKHNTAEHGTVDVMSYGEDVPSAVVRDHDETINEILEKAVVLMRQDVPIPVIKEVMTSFIRERADTPVKDLLNRAFKIYKEESKEKSLPFMQGHEMAEKLITMVNSNAIPTGFFDIDDAMGGGFAPGNFYGMIGPGETYKSILVQWMALHNAKSGTPVLYLNGEMSDRQFLLRAAEMEFKINLEDRIKNKTLTVDDIKRMQDKLLGIWNGNLFVSSMNGFSEEGIHNTLKSIESTTGKKIQLIIMDGIKQMEDLKKDEIRSAIANSVILKEIAKGANKGSGVAVVALYHLSNEITKHFRNTADKVRGGQNTVTNMDGWFGTSLLIDEQKTNEVLNDDIIYFDDKVYLRFHDKRGNGGTINRIIAIHRPTTLEMLSLDPNSFEISLSTQRR